MLLQADLSSDLCEKISLYFFFYQVRHKPVSGKKLDFSSQTSDKNVLTRPQSFNTFFMHNSAEIEIYPAHRYVNLLRCFKPEI